MAALNPYLLKAELQQRNKDIDQFRRTISEQENKISLLQSCNATLRNELSESRQRPESQLELDIASLRLELDESQRENMQLRHQMEKHDQDKQILTILSNLNAQEFKKEEKFIIERYMQQLEQNSALELTIEEHEERLYEHEAERLRPPAQEEEHPKPSVERARFRAAPNEAADLRGRISELQEANETLECEKLRFERASVEIQSALLAFQRDCPEIRAMSAPDEIRRLYKTYTEQINKVEALRIEVEELEDENGRLRKDAVDGRIEAEKAYNELSLQREDARTVIEKLEKLVIRFKNESKGRANEVLGLQSQLERLKNHLKGNFEQL